MTQQTLRILICLAGLAAAASAKADAVCSGEQLATPAGCELHYGDIGFALQASAGGAINQLQIQPSGLAVDNSEVSAELDGTAYRAELADLDGNGWPEIYVYISSAGGTRQLQYRLEPGEAGWVLRLERAVDD